MQVLSLSHLTLYTDHCEPAGQSPKPSCWGDNYNSEDSKLFSFWGVWLRWWYTVFRVLTWKKVTVPCLIYTATRKDNNC